MIILMNHNKLHPNGMGADSISTTTKLDPGTMKLKIL